MGMLFRGCYKLMLIGLGWLLVCCDAGGENKSRSGTSNVRYLQKQLVRARETQRLYERQLGKISASLNAIQDNFAVMTQRMNKYHEKIANLSDRNRRLENEVESLKKALAAERAARKEAMSSLLRQIATETAETINASLKAADQARQSSSTTSGRGPAGKGDFYEHKVEKGHTLSVIAKAYHVSVDDIRRANNLKGDVIRVGQILYIPKR